MRIGNIDQTQTIVPRGIALMQLGQEMLPFEAKLSIGNSQTQRRRLQPQLRSIEVVAALIGFIRDITEVDGDGRGGITMLAEPIELRMVSIAARKPGQHRLGQQPFPPERHQPLRVEVPGMERPEAHQARRRKRSSIENRSRSCGMSSTNSSNASRGITCSCNA